MNKYLFSLSLVFVFSDAFAHVYDVDTLNVASFDYSEIVINNGITISAPGGGDIIVDYPPVFLYNNGTINGRIDTNNNNLFVYNSGIITGGITTQNGGNVTQIITSQSEITNINVIGGNYVVKIDGYQNLDFASIKDFNTDSFVMTGSSVIINNFSDWQNWHRNVNITGPVCLVINDAQSIQSGDVIQNINTLAGPEMLTVQVPGMDDLYSVVVERVGSHWVLNIVRTTDYNVVFGDNDGIDNVLEQIRKKHPNDKMLKAIDNATSQSEIDSIKNSSYRFNHNILLRPIKAINNFHALNMIDEETNSGVDIDISYMFSDENENTGARIYVGENYNNLYFNIGLNINRFAYSDDYNDFSGMSYGLDLHAKQRVVNLWFYETAALSFMKYHADYVDANATLKDNPNGNALYGEFGGGYDFHFGDNLVLSPFVGAVYQKYSVVDINDSDFSLRAGGNIKYDTVMDGIKYKYSLSGGTFVNGDMFSNLGFGFVSINDNVSASIDASVFSIDSDWNYKLSINARVLF